MVLAELEDIAENQPNDLVVVGGTYKLPLSEILNEQINYTIVR